MKCKYICILLELAKKVINIVNIKKIFKIIEKKNQINQNCSINISTLITSI